MIKKYNFNLKCPSVQDYETYLQNKGDTEFNIAFKNHLKKCELCNESIHGFQLTNNNSIKDVLYTTSLLFKSKVIKPKRQFYRALAAASIILLIGASLAYYTIHSVNVANQQILTFNYSLLINNYSTTNKTLTKKSTEQYIYIDNCDKIAYNDQFLSSENIIEVIKNQKNISNIRIEVGTDNYNCANSIINRIKKNQTIPVITITTLRGISVGV